MYVHYGRRTIPLVVAPTADYYLAKIHADGFLEFVAQLTEDSTLIQIDVI